MNYPAYQQPGYPPVPQQPPMQQYPPQAPAYPQQVPQAPAYPQYPAFQQPPAAPPVQPLANGTLDDFYAQPSGGGTGISWKGKPDGYWVQGVVSRDVTNGDVTQDVGAPGSADAGRPKVYRDGRPMLVMSVPLQVQPSAEFPDGEARLFVRGQLREELSRAMAESGAGQAPRQGDVITVTLAQRKQGRGAIPQNIFQVQYQSAHPGQAVAPAVPQQAPPVAPPQPVQQAPQQYAPAPQAVPMQQPPAPVAQAPVQQAPAQPTPVASAPAMANLSPEQAELLARLTGQQPA